MASGNQFYNEEEAQEILRIAAGLPGSGSDSDGISRQTLLQTARELGISEQALAAAEERVATERKDRELYAEFITKRRQSFYGSFSRYLFVNTILIVIDISNGGSYWFYWPLLGWGLGIAREAILAYGPESKFNSHEFQAWAKRRRKRATKSKSESKPKDSAQSASD
ncbi:MAG: 2TM domain-containing protein [Fimbriimonas sp.]